MEPQPSLAEVIEGFAASRAWRHRTDYPVAHLSRPSFARGRCGSASDAFYHALVDAWKDRPDGRHAAAGVAVILVSWRGHPTVGHLAVYARGMIVDWTARQFDPAAAFPLVEPYDVYCTRLEGSPRNRTTIAGEDAAFRPGLAGL